MLHTHLHLSWQILPQPLTYLHHEMTVILVSYMEPINEEEDQHISHVTLKGYLRYARSVASFFYLRYRYINKILYYQLTCLPQHSHRLKTLLHYATF